MSREFTKTIATLDPKKVQAAAVQLNQNCRNCHFMFVAGGVPAGLPPKLKN